MAANPTKSHKKKFGVLEYWSVGAMAKGMMPFLSTLLYSITPGPRLSRTFGNLKTIFLVVVSKNF